MGSREAPAMLLIGLGVGCYMPALPGALGVLNPYVGLILLIIGIVVMLRK